MQRELEMGRGGGCRGLVGVWEQYVGYGPSGEQVGVCGCRRGGRNFAAWVLERGAWFADKGGDGRGLEKVGRENGEREKGKV